MSTTAFVLRRLLGAIPTLALIVALSFLLMRLAPGGPFDAERALPPEIRANFEAAYGLDQPVWVQFGRYLRGLAHGDFGPSYKFRDFTVSELIAGGLPVSLVLGLAAMALALLVGVPAGLWAALHRGRFADRAVMALAVLGISIPVFVVAPFLALVFGIWLRWLPVAGWLPGRPSDLVLPVVALALPVIAVVARLTRGSLLEVLRTPWVRAARARGLPERVVIARHALPAALLPVVSYAGPAAAAVLAGSLVVENLFGLPGMGRHLVQGALNRDYTLVMGMVIVYAAFMIVLNLAADLACAWLDPRIRAGAPPVSTGLWRDARAALAADRFALACLAVLALLAVAAIAGPWLLGFREDEIDWAHVAVPPLAAPGHWLGTDRLGRDLLVRTLHGLRVSLAVALAATAVAVVIGVAWGAFAGYRRGRTDALMMRFVDVLYSLPQVFFVIVLTVVFGRGPLTILLAIGAFGWLTMARIVRGQALALREREFIDAAVVGGATTARIVVRHVVPNLIGPVIVYATLTLPQVILVESFLSFLGIGIQEPLASLGSLVADGAAEMETAPWMLAAPAGCLMLVVFCFNFLGDSLRDALDPRDR